LGFLSQPNPSDFAGWRWIAEERRWGGLARAHINNEAIKQKGRRPSGVWEDALSPEDVGEQKLGK
jgi:hypothetical protein